MKRVQDVAVEGVWPNLGTFALAAAASLAPMANALYNSTVFDSVRLFWVLLLLNLLHLLRHPRVLFCREFALYAAFASYMFVSLLWAPDAVLGLNTLVPTVNFLLLLILFGSLVSFHDLRAVLAGFFGGFLLGAATYTYMEGFPFVYPEGFSYNAGAAMYLFGLFVTLVLSWHTGSRALALSMGFILILHIAATTSIKTNLGILVGVLATAAVFLKRSMRILFRNVIQIVVIAGLVGYAVASNDAVIDRVDSGIERVALGVAVLQAREDASTSTSFDLREYWAARGLEGWASNPVFGDGVEAFRADYGITSHSTPIDLLYNTGVIGFALFYAVFVSIACRLYAARRSGAGSLRALIFAGLVCYLFMTLSGTMMYQAFLATFVAISVALLRRLTTQISPLSASLAGERA